jgi:cyclopropane fatty-acyl-phospholipid synthase-like methyltransferase
MERDVKSYWTNAAQEYRENAYRHLEKQTRYPFYEVRLDLVMDMIHDFPCGRVLDAGCGGGRVLLEFLNKGWDGYGFDFVEAQVQLARETLSEAGYSPNRVSVASVTDLSQYEDKTFDVVLSLGVMEYISPSEEEKAFKETRRVLKDDGVVLVENINGLFDLGTFNRFTIQFFQQHFLPHFFDETKKIDEIIGQLKQLMTYPEKPSREGKYTTTRDEVYTKSEIPLVYGEKVRNYGFCEKEQGFYRFHAVPPLLFERDPALEKISIPLELKLSRHWIGNFLASGFISKLRKV